MPTSYYIDTVTITNREDCCSDRLSDFHIYIDNQLCEDGELLTGGGTYNCGLIGKSLTIRKPYGGYLTLCEVESNGYAIEDSEILEKLGKDSSKVQPIDLSDATAS